jgi:hypothetical protein
MPRPAAHYRIKLRGPVYQVRFTRNGKEHRLSTNTGEQGAARQEAARLVREHDAKPSCAVCGGKPKSGGDTARLAEEFLKAVRRSHGEAYAKRAATDLNQYIIDRWPDPSAITSKSWEEAKLALHEEETARRERLSWGSIANLANTFAPFSVIVLGAGLSGPSLESGIPQRSSLQQIGHICDHWTLMSNKSSSGPSLFLVKSRALRIYIALFETWMRKGELAAMTPRWVDFRQETIHIPARHSKNGHDREIDLTEATGSGSDTGTLAGWAECAGSRRADLRTLHLPLSLRADLRARGDRSEGADRAPRHPQDGRNAGGSETRGEPRSAEVAGRVEEQRGRGHLHAEQRGRCEEGDAMSESIATETRGVRYVKCDHAPEGMCCSKCATDMMMMAMDRGRELDTLKLETERLRGELETIRLMVGLLIPQLNPMIAAAPAVQKTLARCKYGHKVG